MKLSESIRNMRLKKESVTNDDRTTAPVTSVDKDAKAFTPAELKENEGDGIDPPTGESKEVAIGADGRRVLADKKTKRSVIRADVGASSPSGGVNASGDTVTMGESKVISEGISRDQLEDASSEGYSGHAHHTRMAEKYAKSHPEKAAHHKEAAEHYDRASEVAEQALHNPKNTWSHLHDEAQEHISKANELEEKHGLSYPGSESAELTVEGVHFRRQYGAFPRKRNNDHGHWMFTKHERGIEVGQHKEGEDHISVDGTQDQARSKAAAWARKKGITHLYIAESTGPSGPIHDKIMANKPHRLEHADSYGNAHTYVPETMSAGIGADPSKIRKGGGILTFTHEDNGSKGSTFHVEHKDDDDNIVHHKQFNNVDKALNHFNTKMSEGNESKAENMTKTTNEALVEDITKAGAPKGGSDQPSDEQKVDASKAVGGNGPESGLTSSDALNQGQQGDGASDNPDDEVKVKKSKAKGGNQAETVEANADGQTNAALGAIGATEAPISPAPNEKDPVVESLAQAEKLMRESGFSDEQVVSMKRVFEAAVTARVAQMTKADEAFATDSSKVHPDTIAKFKNDPDYAHADIGQGGHYFHHKGGGGIAIIPSVGNPGEHHTVMFQQGDIAKMHGAAHPIWSSESVEKVNLENSKLRELVKVDEATLQTYRAAVEELATFKTANESLQAELNKLELKSINESKEYDGLIASNESKIAELTKSNESLAASTGGLKAAADKANRERVIAEAAHESNLSVAQRERLVKACESMDIAKIPAEAKRVAREAANRRLSGVGTMVGLTEVFSESTIISAAQNVKPNAVTGALKRSSATSVKRFF